MLGGVTVVDPAGVIQWVDRPFGGSREYFVGRSFWDFCADDGVLAEAQTHFAWTLAMGESRESIGTTGGPISAMQMRYSFDRVEVGKYAIISRFSPHNRAKLTAAEEAVCALLMRDFHCSEIASALGIAASTVQSHRQAILQKVGVRGIAGLTRWWEERARWK